MPQPSACRAALASKGVRPMCAPGWPFPFCAVDHSWCSAAPRPWLVSCVAGAGCSRPGSEAVSLGAVGSPCGGLVGRDRLVQCGDLEPPECAWIAWAAGPLGQVHTDAALSSAEFISVSAAHSWLPDSYVPRAPAWAVCVL